MAEMLLWTNSRATSVLWGDFSVKSNLESAKDFSQNLHMPTKSCYWLCCCAFRIRFSQVKVIHLEWSAWIPAINSPQDCYGRGEESREHALHTAHEAENALLKEIRRNTFSCRLLTFRAQHFWSFHPNFFHLSSHKWYTPKLLHPHSQFYTPTEFHLLWMELKKSSNQKGFRQRQVKSRLFGMTYYFDDTEHSKWRRDGASCLSYRVLD